MYPIKEVLSKIKNEKVRYLADRVIDVHYEAFITQPAGCGHHHAYNGGLLVHSTRTAMVTNKLCEMYDGIYNINKSVAIAGALLHDIGKVHCYKVVTKEDGDEEYASTQMSKLHHHIPIGYHLIMKEAEYIRDKKEHFALDSDTLNRLLHIIIAHHGRVEYSSPRAPRTEEAFLVSQADLIDAYLDADKEMRKSFNK